MIGKKTTNLSHSESIVYVLFRILLYIIICEILKQLFLP